MNRQSIHRCRPPADHPALADEDMWFCPECGRGWDTAPGGGWTPAGRSPEEAISPRPDAGFIKLPSGFGRESIEARIVEGQELAGSLVGLRAEDGARLARERGFDPELIAHTVEAVTADLRYNRIRLSLDDSGVVVRASIG